ncbi:MAG: ClC family H(+)/Cl(-) exchange transporter [Tissierellaceae bacterium]|nr:ClC family H(+)/Cl(-) exchange transporter [Tissierellaceae bacterium]
MNTNNKYKSVIDINSKKLPVLYKSILIGLAVGIVASFYRLVLMSGEKLCFRVYDYIDSHLILFPFVFIILCLLGFFVGILVSKYKMISGSGIPQVKGIIMGYFKNNWFSTLIAKFGGGALSILSGLSLGREGPSVQLGACVAQGIGDKFADSQTEKKILIASGASAGLSAAFNAPLAGAMFAMEEIFKYFSPVILLSTMTAAVVSDFIARVIFGTGPVFNFNVQNTIPLNKYWLLFILGAILGIAGAFYNYILLKSQKLYKKIWKSNIKVRMIIPFACAGLLGIFFPIVLGSGNKIIGQLQLSTGIRFLFLILAVKFIFSMVSFGSGAPGGIFFPLLIMGGIIGAIWGNISINYLGCDENLFYNFVILAMAGYFTSIVRAPITGIILLVEMTGSFTHLLSLTVVAVSAYVVADLLKSAPIYDSLLENQISESKIDTEYDKSKKITIETIVHHGCQAENKFVKEIAFPKECLLISIRRGGRDIIPKGNTRILGEDYLVFLINLNEEPKVREILNRITTLQ